MNKKKCIKEESKRVGKKSKGKEVRRKGSKEKRK